jgi:hypothetical protein
MNNNIIEPNDDFDFSKLSLGHPNGIQGGAYFTKILYNNNPLYIQTNKSLTRQGFIKTGKKYYCDLMFDNNSEILIRWFENLEEICQKLIFDKSESWFQNSLEKNDVETAFNSILRIYKSGKYYLLRTYIKNTINNEPSIKIYNENEVPLTINDINTETKLISILEIQGIKFTSRNFQIEIELKQSMVLDDEPIFNNCLIKTSKKNIDNHTNTLETKLDNIKNNDNYSLENFTKSKDFDIGAIKDSKDSNYNIDDNNEYEKINGFINDFNDINDTSDSNNINNTSDINDTSNINDNNEVVSNKTENNIIMDFEDLNEDLKEVDVNINLENNLETFTLKQPNQVYYELYKTAREKAKLAKKNAIIAYLEAKNIKKTYLLDNIDNDDNDSNIDDEIDEVSESELEDL